MHFTSEQEAIIASNAKTIRANAFAGTGKSSTLIGFADARPNERQLMVAFNKSIQLEAAGRFPRNVKCKTGHSLAWFPHGAKYDGKLLADIKPFHITGTTTAYTRSLPVAVVRVFDQRVIETVKAFLVSADEQMGATHVSLGDSPAEKKYLSEHALLAAAKDVWAAMQATSLPMVHDGYLKLYQLSRPRLAYDTIMIDEAQDTNPVLQSILQSQSARLLYVGDRHQGIYSFRGSQNAMELVKADASFYLTGSFRFGPAVAEVANRILALKGESAQLRGLGMDTIVDQGAFENPRGTAFISRTNAAVFDKANNAVGRGIKVAYVGGVHTYRFEIGEDISKLRQFGPADVRNPFIASFESFESLAEYAEAVQDKELTGWAKVVERYGGKRFDQALNRIRAEALQFDSASPEQRDALVVVTAHRSKGLEFDHVELAENFIDTVDEDTGKLRDFSDAERQTIEEVNLLYVAATRARKELATNCSIAQLFDPELAPDDHPSASAAIA
ncbi:MULTISPECIES: UvrD-helicase domain-containing protein [Xanthomonas]|uniref:UvrD-helicase domain-containing protein n=1 Tax=Xanthomonas TaxID=338 RepID=UPI0009B804A8|nr:MULTISPECIES: UvrD-helicase domain-containing protein [Xanthomonas]MCC8726299.1 UvrD-helicase domain-containing protein [Xanthomonas euvesicatoria pv. euvesicatoria]MCC8746044.1 UvrD-helicase domain-containing protein [Xanthomonas euvesicatoria pv. euvesicatoria]MCC8762218.1 UvrD-helicase domain-containing protein [Xanthomonas euvesicatoria pv. euvesicatoria]MCC8775164.1 UvrD-helicase domain-containing protein [Xanthomonas euvesicatoria pv. euvesicatoria]MCC8803717.1 UvrD-helicase domain-co